MYQDELNAPDVQDMIVKMKESGIVLANAKKKYAAAFIDETKMDKAQSDEKLDKTYPQTEVVNHQKTSPTESSFTKFNKKSAHPLKGINDNLKKGRISDNLYNTVRHDGQNAFKSVNKGILNQDDLFLKNMENDLKRKSYQISDKMASGNFGSKNIDHYKDKLQNQFNKNFKVNNQK